LSSCEGKIKYKCQWADNNIKDFLSFLELMLLFFGALLLGNL